MDIKEITDLVSDPRFIQSVQKISEKSGLEIASFIAVIASAVIATLAIAIAAYQLLKQIKEWRETAKSVADQLGVARHEISLIGQGMKEDHDRSRREYAIDLIKYWASNYRHESQSTRVFVETLNKEQGFNIFWHKPLDAQPLDKRLLAACLQHSFPLENLEDYLENGFVKPVYAAHIRFTVIAYLNSLEVVMIAWLHNIADRKIIETEFEFLVDASEKKAALETFRIATGLENFPGINAFVAAINNRKKVASGYDPLGDPASSA